MDGSGTLPELGPLREGIWSVRARVLGDVFGSVKLVLLSLDESEEAGADDAWARS